MHIGHGDCCVSLRFVVVEEIHSNFSSEWRELLCFGPMNFEFLVVTGNIIVLNGTFFKLAKNFAIIMAAV